MCYNGLAVWLVADFEVLSCQATRKFIRCINTEIPTVPAIKHTACAPSYFIFFCLVLNQYLNTQHSIVICPLKVCFAP